MTRKTGRAGLILLLALALLVGLTVTVWAAWGSAWRGSLATAGEARLTATPTRTPRPATLTPKPGPVEPVIHAFTPIPAPIPSPTANPQAQKPQTVALTPYLAQVVAQYGMNPARRFIVVDPNRQRMTIWEPGQPTRELLISTGDEEQGYRTPAWYGLVGKYWGTFHAFGTYADEGWYLYDDPTGSILIHSAPYRLIDGKKHYEGLDALGNYPASHGCIRLLPEDARWFTSWKPQGAPIVILPKKIRSQLNRATGDRWWARPKVGGRRISAYFVVAPQE
jgi:lipoprotein-anchoring transpeptidase ErfK/SrfK